MRRQSLRLLRHLGSSTRGLRGAVYTEARCLAVCSHLPLWGPYVTTGQGGRCAVPAEGTAPATEGHGLAATRQAGRQGKDGCPGHLSESWGERKQPREGQPAPRRRGLGTRSSQWGHLGPSCEASNDQLGRRLQAKGTGLAGQGRREAHGELVSKGT